MGVTAVERGTRDEMREGEKNCSRTRAGACVADPDEKAGSDRSETEKEGGCVLGGSGEITHFRGPQEGKQKSTRTTPQYY